MNRRSGIVSCTFLLAGGLAGFAGGLRCATQNREQSELTLPMPSGTGWHLASGIESGSAVTVSPGMPQTAVENNVEPPDVVWFPDAVPAAESASGSSGELSDSGPEMTPRTESLSGDALSSAEPLTAEQREMWKNQIKGLSAADAEELFKLRQQLSGTVDPVASSIESQSALERSGQPPGLESEPGRLPLPAPDKLQPALPEGPLLPDSIELMGGTRAVVKNDHPLLAQAGSAVRDNLANAATTGYRRREVRILRAPVSGSGDGSLQDVDPGDWITRIDLRPGRIVATQNPFDVAICSSGWFRVQCDAADRFTRCGLLAMDTERRLCIRTGLGLLPLVPETVLPPDMELMEIDNRGKISVQVAGDGNFRDGGQIELVDFRDAGHLAWSAEGVYAATADSGNPFRLPEKKIELQQKSLEESNVDPADEVKLLDRLKATIRPMPTSE